jgi:O-acetyl-ADP-ribose deacetylase (regulator of RNase III)
LGTGSAGVEPAVAAPSICQALKDFIDETGSGMEIQLIIYQDEMYAAFEDAMAEAMGPDEPTQEEA